MFTNRILCYKRISSGQRSICLSSFVHKKHVNPEEQVIVNKTNQRSTNKKTLSERKMKQKPTVWGVIDVYRFITVEKLASLMKKSVGKHSKGIKILKIERSRSFKLQVIIFKYFRGIAGGAVIFSTDQRYTTIGSN